MVRHAFTMIELIFALVIMSIVFISLPMILINNSTSLEDNLVQESIFLSSSKMSQALTFQWDNNSTESGMGTVATSDVLDVTLGDNDLDRAIGDFRIGHFQEDKHRRMSPAGAPRNATAIGREGVVYDDIDDFDNVTHVMNLVSANLEVAKFQYKKSYRADIDVSYINDGNFLNATTYDNNSIDFILSDVPAGATTNIKMIEVSIDQQKPDTTWETTILLRAYVANIGETDYFKRRY